MPDLDTRTLIAAVSITSISCSVILIILYMKNLMFRSILYWIFGIIIIGIANLIITFRGSMPDALSIIGSNFLLMASPVLFFQGTKKFMNIKKSSIPIFSVLAVSTFCFVLVYYLNLGVKFRIIIHSIEFAAAFLMISILCFSEKSEKFRRTGTLFGVINLSMASVSFLRFVFVLFSDDSPDILNMHGIHILILFMFNLLIMLSTLGFFQMINDVLQFQLKKKSEELELESRRLNDKDKRILVELELAVKIQRKSIPESSPAENISYLYKPMHQLGGDFFDFISFKDSDDTGIFISDVTGHGAPAALITSMIKTALLQSGSARLNPAELLTYMDETLRDLAAENFVTAFYAIYKNSEKKIVYSNAGHCRPYIINENGVKILHTAPARPLCVEYGVEKPFVNSELLLAEKTKFVLYTDGLTEAVESDDSRKFYEDNGLLDSMYEARNMPVKNFIEKVYKDLVRYRGSERFDDDICIICIDN